MKEYNVINSCLSLLKASRIDAMTKLRIESILVGIKMLLLVDVEQQGMPGIEELLTHVESVCSGQSADGVHGLLDYARKVQLAMAASLDLAA